MEHITKTEQIEILKQAQEKHLFLLRAMTLFGVVYFMAVFMLYFLGFISDPIVRLGCQVEQRSPKPVMVEIAR